MSLPYLRTCELHGKYEAEWLDRDPECPYCIEAQEMSPPAIAQAAASVHDQYEDLLHFIRVYEVGEAMQDRIDLAAKLDPEFFSR